MKIKKILSKGKDIIRLKFLLRFITIYSYLSGELGLVEKRNTSKEKKKEKKKFPYKRKGKRRCEEK